MTHAYIAVNAQGDRKILETKLKEHDDALNALETSSVGAAGGSLTGTYPNPTIAANAVTEAMLIGTVASAPQALSGPGAVNVTTRTTLYTSTGAGDALTLANGVRTGQRKNVIHTVDGGSGVLTPTTVGNFATVTFTVLYDWVELEWSGAAWNVVAYGGATFT